MQPELPNKPRILVFNLHYLPAFKAGGVVRSLSNITSNLSSKFDFHIVAGDRDIGDTNPFPEVQVRQWHSNDDTKVFYLNTSLVSMSQLIALIKGVNPDLVYLNSFFDRRFTFKVLLARRLGFISTPVILAPHGEFSPGALRLKARRKRLYFYLSRFIHLYTGLNWHASTSREHDDIRRALPYVRESQISIAMNMAKKVQPEDIDPKQPISSAALSVCFLSRIAPMKNLDFAIRALSLARSEVKLSIFGPIEDFDYWNQCKLLIEALPSNISVEYHGPVHSDDVHSVLRNHSVFFLPTRGENYGHVIHEALLAGLPTLISDQTPWRDLEAAGVGWALPLESPSNFARKIDEISSWSADKRSIVSTRAAEYGQSISSNQDAANSTVTMFVKAIRAQ